MELDATQKVDGTEPGGGLPAGQVKLKDRQKFFEEAFQQDMEQYLSTGYLQIAERRDHLPLAQRTDRLYMTHAAHRDANQEPIGSMSSMEVNVDMLEQMDLMDMSDHEALDVFLHSGGEDNSAASPVAGPEVDFTTEISLQVPTQAELRHKLSSLSSTCTDSASQDTEAGEEEDEDDEEERAASGKKRPPVMVTPDDDEVHADTSLVDVPARKDGERSSRKV
ncbi:dystrobrevin binding protein 1b isoform X2 [Dunckerocampus dactyliophorus]|uniref:dystrobrevin binding protein 1b isoform X2 n=1 Tax=Dunckerocampus dactyliophorus TaxID=161453 RepID=UPI002406FC63|nr:dystrobrevin binding protein 1b isoform X2 [Dunckerocampus dactyliophorus]